jgi:hypothetical protein
VTHSDILFGEKKDRWIQLKILTHLFTISLRISKSSMEPAYSAAQLSSYEEFISLPQRFRLVNKPALTSEYLNSLHVHQISKVPYENLLLHYSKDHAVSLDPQVIFQKTLGNRRGRGGYCMENSIMFNHVLRGLGFKAYLSGARVRPRTNGIPSGDYSGWYVPANKK